MDARERTGWVVAKAEELGFDLCGVAPPGRFPELGQMAEWLERGHAGEMRYLHDPRRQSLDLALEGIRSVIVCAASYKTPEPLSTQALARPDAERPRGWISRYGWGDDYHDVLLPRLRALVDAMRGAFGVDFRSRAYVDTGPVAERVAAKYAGLGWLGKNTCLINRNMGSWIFLGAVVTTLELEPTLAEGQPPPPDLCGSCRRCIDACPTGALVEPYVLDARRCIAYLTIELRGPIPEEFRPAIGQMVFGCDICQDVCPWNGKAPLARLAEFRPRQLTSETRRGDSPCGDVPAAGHQAGDARVGAAGEPDSLFAPELEWLAGLDETEYRRVFRKNPVKRAKWRGLVRNAAVALGNSELTPATRRRVAPLLERLAASADPLIAEHARWALERMAANR
ncbi:MAG TPA: tRNA epoxyqueuosine(34) reductase QueG [Candidatus Acidoferrales bacterium]|nr:tRNA epoxyqueuosine(34) reductase QueG [Candidatus Acidoferrales bacterium]